MDDEAEVIDRLQRQVNEMNRSLANINSAADHIFDNTQEIKHRLEEINAKIPKENKKLKIVYYAALGISLVVYLALFATLINRTYFIGDYSVKISSEKPK